MQGQSTLSATARNEAWQATLAGSPLIKDILNEESDFLIGISRLLAWQQSAPSEKPRLVLPVAFRLLEQGTDSGDADLKSSIAHFFQFLRQPTDSFESQLTFSAVDFFGPACAGQDEFLFPLQQMGLIEPVPSAPDSTELDQWRISEHLRTWILHAKPKDLFMIFVDGGRGYSPHYFASMLSIDRHVPQASKLRCFDPQIFDREVAPQMSETYQAFVLQCVGPYLSDEPDIKDLSQAVRVAYSCMDWVLWFLDHLEDLVEDPDAFNSAASQRGPNAQVAFRLSLYRDFITLCQSKGLDHDLDQDASAFDQMMKIAYDGLISNVQNLINGDDGNDPLMQDIKTLLPTPTPTATAAPEPAAEPAPEPAAEPAPEPAAVPASAPELHFGSGSEFEASESLSPRDGGGSDELELGSGSEASGSLSPGNSSASVGSGGIDVVGSNELDSGSDTASAPEFGITVGRWFTRGVFCLAGLAGLVVGILSAGGLIFKTSVMLHAAPLWLSAVSLHPFICVCVGLILIAHGLGLDSRVYQWACMQDQKTGTMRRQNIVFKLMAGALLLSAAVPIMYFVFPMPLFMPCIAAAVICVWISNVYGPQSKPMPQIASSGTPSPHAARQFHPVGQQRSSLSASQSIDGPDASASRSLSPPTV